MWNLKVWNSFGVIKNYKSEGECTIEINFHDSTIHHEIIMDNSATNYTIGDINADFIALASKRNSNKESELYVHHVTSWDHESRKWNQQMDQGEVIECLCLGQQFIAIYTTLRYLRIFTPSGTQRFVISLPGFSF
jgi:chromosome transmission fidelity protein 4